MSTKTTFKRIALVTVAALGFSGLAVVASTTANAANAGNVALYCYNGTTNDTASTFGGTSYASGADAGGGLRDSATAAACSAIAGAANSIKLTVNTTGFANNLFDTTTSAAAFVEITGGSILGTATSIDSGTVINAARTQMTVSESGTVGLSINTPTVGTITVKLYKSANGGTTYSSTAAETVVITVNAASVKGTLSLTNSTSILDSGTASASGTVDETIVGSGLLADAGKQYGIITVSVKDTQYPAVAINANTVYATVSGPGLVVGGNARSTFDDPQGTARTGGARVATVTTTDGTAYFAVVSDGTPGVSTITISVGTTELAKETVTFYGAAATLTPTQVLSVAPLAGGTLGANSSDKSVTDPAFTIKAVDAAGNPVKGLTTSSFTAVSSDATVLSKTITVTADAAAGYYNVQVSSVANSTSVGKSATLTVSYALSSTSSISAAPVTFTLGGGTVYAVAMSADKGTYAPGELVTATLTAKDKYGSPIADGTYALFDTSAASTAVVPSASLTSKPFGTTGSVAFVGGKATATFYAPYGSGAFTLTGTFNTAVATTTAATKVVGTFNLADNGVSAATDAANEATDAANAATDAANAAAEAADAATAAAQDASDAVAALSTKVDELIGALKKQITTLTNLVIKIQKKVKA